MSSAPDSISELVVKASQRRRPPSPRNVRIADEVRVLGRTQATVAAAYRLSQRRISQICQQVQRWEASTQPWQRQEEDGDERCRAEQVLAGRQIQEIYRRSMRAFERSEQALVTQRRGTRADGQAWSEENRREQRLDTQALRVAQRAIEQSWNLADRRPPSDDLDEDQEQELRTLIEQLTRLRRDAADQRQPRVKMTSKQHEEVVRQWLRELITDKAAGAEGASPQGPANYSAPAAAEASAAAAEVSRRPCASSRAQRVYIDPSGNAHLIDEDVEGAEEFAVRRRTREGSGFGVQASGDRGKRTGDREQPTEDSGPTTANRSQGSAEYSVPGTRYSVPECEGVSVRECESASAAISAPSPSYPHTRTLSHQIEDERAHADAVRQARRQLDDEFGLALSGEQIAEALAHQRRADAGQFVADAYNRTQIAALRQWERLTRRRRRGGDGENERRREADQ